MELARGSNFLKKNREATALPMESSLYDKIKLQSQNDLRQRQALRNKRIIEHENTEKRKFLSEKHDLLKSVSYLHRIHEHNQTQNLYKQRVWMEVLLIHKFCGIAVERFKVSTHIVNSPNRVGFRIKKLQTRSSRCITLGLRWLFLVTTER